MIISLRKWFSFVRFIIIFAALTYMFYRLLSLFGQWITPVDHYRIPEGHAVKVFQSGADAGAGETMAERLRFFYWYGE